MPFFYSSPEQTSKKTSSTEHLCCFSCFPHASKGNLVKSRALRSTSSHPPLLDFWSLPCGSCNKGPMHLFSLLTCSSACFTHMSCDKKQQPYCHFKNGELFWKYWTILVSTTCWRRQQTHIGEAAECDLLLLWIWQTWHLLFVKHYQNAIVSYPKMLNRCRSGHIEAPHKKYWRSL